LKIKKRLETYKGSITRSKSKQIEICEVEQSSKTEKKETQAMGDREERNGVLEINREERNDRNRIPQRRARNMPLNLRGEQHQLPTLPQGVLPICSGDRVMDPKRHMDQFLAMCEIRLIYHDDVMVRVFLQMLIGPTYEWYMSLPAQSIS
jgi:hypothetical protein